MRRVRAARGARGLHERLFSQREHLRAHETRRPHPAQDADDDHDYPDVGRHEGQDGQEHEKRRKRKLHVHDGGVDDVHLGQPEFMKKRGDAESLVEINADHRPPEACPQVRRMARIGEIEACEEKSEIYKSPACDRA